MNKYRIIYFVKVRTGWIEWNERRETIYHVNETELEVYKQIIKEDETIVCAFYEIEDSFDNTQHHIKQRL